MESRRITLLTQGFLFGWLDFDYKTSTSRLREDLILSEVERTLLWRFISAQTGVEATLAAGNPSAASFAIPLGKLEKWPALALPWLQSKANMKEDSSSMTPDNIAKWKSELAATKKHFTKEK